jgi:hypothetical protein
MQGSSFGALALALALSGPAAAADKPADKAVVGPVAAPVFKPGDSWVFVQTTEKGQTGFAEQRLDVAVERVDSDTILVGVKPDGAPTGYQDRIFGADWSRRQVVAGQETVTGRPFAFPMSVGQSWKVDYVDPIRRGNVLSAHVQATFTVVGWEQVTTPAGTFRALKVVRKGLEQLTVEAPAQAVTGTVAGSSGATSIAHAEKGGRGVVNHVTYGETWYVPELKNYVKAMDEQYNADNVRLTRQTSVLASFKPGA